MHLQPAVFALNVVRVVFACLLLTGQKELLYLDLALEDQVRAAAERGVGIAGFGAAAFMRPLLQNLALSRGDNEEVCYCLKVTGLA